MSIIGRLIDGHVQRLLPADSSIESQLRQIQAIYDAAMKAVSDAQANPDLTKEGRQRAAAAALQKASADLAPHERRVIDVHDEAEKTRRAALARLPGLLDPARSDEERADEEYARQQLAALPPTERNSRFVDAVQRGNTTIVNAALRATRAGFPLVDDAFVQKLDEVRLSQSPLKELVEAADFRAWLYHYIVERTTMELADSARLHGVMIERTSEPGRPEPAGLGAPLLQ